VDPAGSYAEGTLQFGMVTLDWMPSTRSPDLPAGVAANAARSIAVDGEVICDFSDYSRLHSVVYEEVTAGRGHRIEDARDATRHAERIRDVAGRELLAAPCR
jgi:hypothetical protein